MSVLVEKMTEVLKGDVLDEKGTEVLEEKMPEGGVLEGEGAAREVDGG